MAEENFLPYFIEEPIYVIKTDAPTVATPAAEEVLSPKVNTAEPIVEVPVASAVQESKVEEPEPVYVKALPTSGDNLKHCIVLVNSEEDILEESLQTLLYKIMGSVKRKSEDILLANCHQADEEQIAALLANNNHRHVLTFGVNLLPTLATASPYEIVKAGAVSMLKADSLNLIDQETEKKKALWKALQEMF